MTAYQTILKNQPDKRSPCTVAIAFTDVASKNHRWKTRMQCDNQGSGARYSMCYQPGPGCERNNVSLHYVHNTVIESPVWVGVMEIKVNNDYAEIYITPVNFSDTVPIRLSVHNLNARVFLWLRRLAVTQTLSLR